MFFTETSAELWFVSWTLTPNFWVGTAAWKVAESPLENPREFCCSGATVASIESPSACLRAVLNWVSLARSSNDTSSLASSGRSLPATSCSRSRVACRPLARTGCDFLRFPHGESCCRLFNQPVNFGEAGVQEGRGGAFNQTGYSLD